MDTHYTLRNTEESMGEQSFTAMAGPKAAAEAPEIGVGMLGYAFMGKSHSNAYKKLPYMMYPPVAIPRLLGIAGRNEEAVKEAAHRFGYEALLHRLAQDAGGRPHQAVRQRRPQRLARGAMRRGRGGGQARPLREADGPQRRRSEAHVACGRTGRHQAHGRLQLPLRPGRPPGVRPDPERQAGRRSTTSARSTCRNGSCRTTARR